MARYCVSNENKWWEGGSWLYRIVGDSVQMWTRFGWVDSPISREHLLGELNSSFSEDELLDFLSKDWDKIKEQDSYWNSII